VYELLAGRLTVGEESARDLLRGPALAEVRLGCAAPGDSVRIVGVLDAVQPCSKGPGGGGVFPGLLGPALPVGRGETHVLRGAAVLAAGYLPRAQEAIMPGRTSTRRCGAGSSRWRPTSKD